MESEHASLRVPITRGPRDRPEHELVSPLRRHVRVLVMRTVGIVTLQPRGRDQARVIGLRLILNSARIDVPSPHSQIVSEQKVLEGTRGSVCGSGSNEAVANLVGIERGWCCGHLWAERKVQLSRGYWCDEDSLQRA